MKLRREVEPEPDDGLIFFGVAFSLGMAVTALALLIATGCAHAPTSPVTDHVTTVTVTERCATQPRPKLAPVPPPTECQPRVICWPVEQAAVLASNVEALKTWVEQTARLCGR